MGELEVLLAEGDADDGDVEKATEEHVSKPYPQSTDEEPQDVHARVQATTCWFLLHLRAKGP